MSHNLINFKEDWQFILTGCLSLFISVLFCVVLVGLAIALFVFIAKSLGA